MRLLRNNVVRWLTWALLATVFAALCLVLANWQLDRRSEAVAKLTRVSQNYERPPVDGNDLFGQSEKEIVSKEWQPVTLVGNYVADETLLVRNRPIAGQPGYLQIIPFETSDGQLVIVERGWIPAASDLSPSREIIPSTSEKSITARVKLGELAPNRDSPTGQITSINLEEIRDSYVAGIETSFYLRLISETPAESSYPQPLGKPLLDEGNHLSYAVQWILFAVMGFYALFWAMRQERELKKPSSAGNSASKYRSKKQTDSEAEDELLDRIS